MCVRGGGHFCPLSFHFLPYTTWREPGSAFQKRVCVPEQTAYPDILLGPTGMIMEPYPASKVQKHKGEEIFTLASIATFTRDH